jgi:hypothetical protein
MPKTFRRRGLLAPPSSRPDKAIYPGAGDRQGWRARSPGRGGGGCARRSAPHLGALMRGELAA